MINKITVTAALALSVATLSVRVPVARAQTLYGVLNGLSISWSSAGNLLLNPGEAYVAGNLYHLAAGGSIFAFSLANLQNGQALAANTPYYIYLCWDTSSMPNAWSANPVISNIFPTTDGQPNAAIQTHSGDNCDVQFLGSVLTDSLLNLVQFEREGETVILNPVNNTTNPCTGTEMVSGAGQTGTDFSNTSGTCLQMQFNSESQASCNGYDNSPGNEFLDLPYPASASAMLLDFNFSNTDPNLYHSLFIPPQTPNPAGPTNPSNGQAFFQISTSTNLVYFQHTRVNPKVINGVNIGHTPAAPTKSATFYICIDQAPTATYQVGVGAIYRGYVESIGHLTVE